jgi:hypothetical protein
MHLTAICPTFRRPRLIPNVLAMFAAQTYSDCDLLIYDDGGTFDSQCGDRWELMTRPERCTPLGSKFRELVSIAISRGTDGIVLFEDDDIYGPNYLRDHATAQESAAWVVPDRVWTDNGCKPHEVQIARYTCHGCWSFTASAYEAAGGYPGERSFGFDIAFGDRLLSHTGKPARLWREPPPQYIYRWQSTGYPNGHGFGESMEQAVEASHRPARVCGVVRPEMDAATTHHYRSLWS